MRFTIIMGQKIRPDSLRLNIIENWKRRWWPKKGFKNQLEEDMEIRKIVNERVKQGGIIRIEIERTAQNAFKVFLKVARPGLVIGRGGKGIEELSKAIEHKLKSLLESRGTKKPTVAINLTVDDLKKSEISAQYIAQSIAWDLEKRMPALRTIKKYLDLMMQNKQVGGA